MINRTPLFHTFKLNKTIARRRATSTIFEQKNVLFKIEEDVLEDFDTICKEQKISRSEGIRRLMTAATGNGEMMDMGDVK